MNEEILKYTIDFHNTYETLSSKYDYETRKDTKEFDINSSNGKLMYVTVEHIFNQILQELKNIKEKNDYLEHRVEYLLSHIGETKGE